jgi:hypothetical protein
MVKAEQLRRGVECAGTTSWMKLYGVHVGAKRSVPPKQQWYGSQSFVEAAHPLPSALPRPPGIKGWDTVITNKPALDSHPLVLPAALLLTYPSPGVVPSRVVRSAAYRSRISSHLSPSIPTSLYKYPALSLLLYTTSCVGAVHPQRLIRFLCRRLHVIFMCISQALCFQRQQPGARPTPWVRPPASQNYWRRLPILIVCSRSIESSGRILANPLSRTR